MLGLEVRRWGRWAGILGRGSNGSSCLPEVQGGWHAFQTPGPRWSILLHSLPAPDQRQKSQLFPRSGVEDPLSCPIQSPGVIPLIQRCFEQHPLDLFCLEQDSSGAWAGHEPFGVQISGSKPLFMPQFGCRTSRILQCHSLWSAGCAAVHQG